MARFKQAGISSFAGVIFSLLALSVILPSKSFAQAAQFLKPAQPLPLGRAFHGTAIMGDFIYVIAGSSERPDPEQPTGVFQYEDNTVLKARIMQGNGPGEWRLSQWEETTPLPLPLHYIGNSTLVLNDVVYVIGGSTLPLNGEFQNTAFWSKPLADGSLTPWQRSKPFGSKLSTLTAVSTPGHIHVIGGLKQSGPDAGGTGPSAEVWSNQIFSDGTMGNWFQGPNLPLPIWFHCAGVAANRVYIWGGLADTAPDVQYTSNLVFSAQILGTGRLGQWRQEPASLQSGLYSASTSVAGPYLISFSPRYPRPAPDQPAINSSDVWWTYITPNGMYPWTREPTPLPNRVYHSVTPDYRRGTIWITGGRPATGEDMTRNVAYFTLSEQARRLAENQWASAQAAHSNTVATFDTLSVSSGDGEQGADQLSFLADRRLSEDAVEGFRTISDARRTATRNGQEKPLIMYFNIETAQLCVQQKQILESADFASIADDAAFAWVNTREYPQLAQQMGIYRIPTWVFYDKAGNEVQRMAQVVQADQLSNMVQNLQ